MTHSREEVLADCPEVSPEDAAGRRERLLVGFLSLAAAVHVFLFAAAFPFFNSVDESLHFDLVCKYSHGELPQGLDLFSAEAAPLIALYGSPEYFTFRRDLPSREVGPPVWCYPAKERARVVQNYTDTWRGRENYESIQMPLYYTVVGVWYNLGKGLGLTGGNLLYWARFFNVPVYIALVWLAYLFSKELLPHSRFVYLGVPCVLAFFPQDIFYGLNNDILSAPMVTLALYLLLRMVRIERPSPGLALGAGLSVAAAVLTKFANAPIFVVLAIVVVLKLGPSWWKKQPLAHLVPVVLLVAAASIPVACWLARNYFAFGDLMGFALNNRFKTWTPKPVSEYWHHPMFSLGGFLFFWRRLALTIWRGEMYWYGDDLAAAHIDAFYFYSSTVFLLIFGIAACVKRGSNRAEIRLAAGLCWLLFALSVAILVLVSVSFDFGTSFYPSRQLPFLPSGRLIMGSLVPFLILYLGGLEALLGWLRLSFMRIPVLIVIIDLMVMSQIGYSVQVFASQYNWFHLP
jgi:hypothetical protein